MTPRKADFERENPLQKEIDALPLWKVTNLKFCGFFGIPIDFDDGTSFAKRKIFNQAKGNNLRGCKLSGMDLSALRKSSMTLPSGTTIETLAGADLRDADLSGANLYKLHLNFADLRDANLCGVNLRKASLCFVDFRGANLRNADLRDVDLGNADLRGADLRGANLCNADLREVDLRKADLRGAILLNNCLHHADIRGSNLSEINLIDSIKDIKHYDLQYTHVSFDQLKELSQNKEFPTGSLRDLTGAFLSNINENILLLWLVFDFDSTSHIQISFDILLYITKNMMLVYNQAQSICPDVLPMLTTVNEILDDDFQQGSKSILNHKGISEMRKILGNKKLDLITQWQEISYIAESAIAESAYRYSDKIAADFYQSISHNNPSDFAAKYQNMTTGTLRP